MEYRRIGSGNTFLGDAYFTAKARKSYQTLSIYNEVYSSILGCTYLR
jgi:hypothetical protein